MRVYALADIAAGMSEAPQCLSDPKSFFVQPGWFALIDSCGGTGGNGASVLVLEDRRVAVACYRVPGEGLLRSCTNLYTPRFDLLGESADAVAVRGFMRELAGSMDGFDRLRFEGLDPADAAFAAILEGLRASGWIARPYFGWGVWSEHTAGMEFQNYFATRASALRHTWKRKHAALAKTTESRWQVYRDGDDPEPFITLYEDVRTHSWKAPEPHPEFVPGLIRLAAASGALRMGVLFIGERAAAAQFWIVWAGRATIYKLVYAEEFAQFSPGTLLTMEMMRRVLEQDRPVEIDFGRGDDSYKRLWLHARSERWGIEAANPRTLRGFSRSLWIGAGEATHSLRKKLRSSLRRFRRAG
jgi:hypothetical protein